MTKQSQSKPRCIKLTADVPHGQPFGMVNGSVWIPVRWRPASRAAGGWDCAIQTKPIHGIVRESWVRPSGYRAEIEG